MEALTSVMGAYVGTWSLRRRKARFSWSETRRECLVRIENRVKETSLSLYINTALEIPLESKTLIDTRRRTLITWIWKRLSHRLAWKTHSWSLNIQMSKNSRNRWQGCPVLSRIQAYFPLGSTRHKTRWWTAHQGTSLGNMWLPQVTDALTFEVTRNTRYSFAKRVEAHKLTNWRERKFKITPDSLALRIWLSRIRNLTIDIVRRQVLFFKLRFRHKRTAKFQFWMLAAAFKSKRKIFWALPTTLYLLACSMIVAVALNTIKASKR